jgi:hypothetical protein
MIIIYFLNKLNSMTLMKINPSLFINKRKLANFLMWNKEYKILSNIKIFKDIFSNKYFFLMNFYIYCRLDTLVSKITIMNQKKSNDYENI